MKNSIFCALYFSSFLSMLFLVIFMFDLEGKLNLYQGLPDEDKMIYKFIDFQGKILGEKYKMKQCGNGLGGMDKIWLISLSFERISPSTNENEARNLIVHCVEDLLEAINSNEELKPLLQTYPFNAKNIKLDIYNLNNNKTEQTFPNISVVGNNKGKVCYLSVSPENKYSYHTEKYETYDEAVAILKEK